MTTPHITLPDSAVSHRTRTRIRQYRYTDAAVLCGICRKAEADCTGAGRHQFEPQRFPFVIVRGDEVVSVHPSRAEATASQARC